MKLLKDYFDLQQNIYNYFGYEEGWVVIPIEDDTGYYWMVDPNESECVIFAIDQTDFYNGDYYKNEIYNQRHLPKYVFRGEDYTMIAVDTHTDGNKFLQIFSNSKEVPYESGI